MVRLEMTVAACTWQDQVPCGEDRQTCRHSRRKATRSSTIPKSSPRYSRFATRRSWCTAYLLLESLGRCAHGVDEGAARNEQVAAHGGGPGRVDDDHQALIRG